MNDHLADARACIQSAAQAPDREIRAQALREREQQMRLAEEFAATTGRGLAEWLAVVEALSGPPDTPRADQIERGE